MRRLMLGCAAAAALVPLAVPAGAAERPAGQSPAERPAGQCFFTRDWRGWRAVDRNALYARVGVNRIFKIEFANGCPGLTSPNARLVTQSVTGQVCTALDLDIQVANPPGGPTPCIISKITPLTAAEVAALPKKLTP